MPNGKRSLEDVTLGVIIGLALFGSTCGIATVVRDFRRDFERSPSNVYGLESGSKPDLNSDGVPDIVVRHRNGYRFPLYGVPVERVNGSYGRDYVSSDEMVRRSVARGGSYHYEIQFYYGIERSLNK
ncbi:hypothetical protein HY640_03960 [Candidatus Woesearchaeota archaeon]|nr:hypothetical protein [Candidatus Woesearchaeota archaeon]